MYVDGRRYSESGLGPGSCELVVVEEHSPNNRLPLKATHVQ